MLETVLKALKETSKGSLHYDRFWVHEGRAKDVLSSVSNLSRLNCSLKEPYPLPEGSPDDNAGPEGSPKDVPRETPKTSPAPSKRDNWQDTCAGIIEYEDDRKRRVQECVQWRVSQMECMDLERRREQCQQVELLEQERRVERQREKDHITQMQIQEFLEVKEQESKLKENRKTHAKRLNEKIREAEERQRQEEEMEFRRREEQREREEHLSSYQSQLQTLATSFAEALSSCIDPRLLVLPPRQHMLVVGMAEEALQQIVEPIREWTMEDVQGVRTIISNTRNALAQLQADVVQANAKAREAESKAREAETKVQEAETKGEPASPAIVNRQETVIRRQETVESHDKLPDKEPETTDSKMTTKDLGLLSGCVDVESYSLYQGLMNEINKWEQVYIPLENDEKLKKLRFELKKAVNTPVNAISSQSGRQLRDKLDRLLGLLAGAPVAGRVSCQSHPLATHFCAHLLAKKIVLQAESQVASHQEAAFPLAAVAVGLWGRYPKFGELLLAQLYLRCPYLLPIYHQQAKGQDEEQFHRQLGYNYENGEMEDQDQFLKRMSGIVCFYAALLQTMPPRGYANHHPHGIQHGWLFLARLINLRPRFDITATVLYHFLVGAGSALYGVYGKQMHKLVCCLHNEYMEQIRRVSIGESGGPVSRLETFLAETVRNRRIMSPDGLLGTGFWNT